MNHRHTIAALVFVSGAFTGLAVSDLVAPSVAGGQGANTELLQRMRYLENRVMALEYKTSHDVVQAEVGAAIPVSAFQTSPNLPRLTLSLDLLQDEINGLETRLQRLQSQFANHYHTWTSSVGGGVGTGVMTILTCQGYGQPCVSATGAKDITVLTPSNVPPPPPHQVTNNTSGPVIPGN